MGTTFVRDHMTSFGGYPRVSEDASLFDAAQALVEGGQRLDARGHRYGKAGMTLSSSCKKAK